MDTIWQIFSLVHNKLSLIPDVIWSGVIASVLTLSGVLISNRSNTNRLKLQLEHDSKQKDEDRKAAIRRDVYLEIAKEAINASNHLANIANIDLTDKNINKGLNGYFVAAAKLMVVADTKTTFAANELSSMYSALVMEVTPDVFKIAEYDNMAKTYQKQQDDIQLEIKRILSAQTEFIEAPQPKDEQIFKTLQFAFQQQQEFSSKILSEGRKFSSQKIAAQLEFSQFLLPKLLKIADQQIEVWIAIREELGLSSDIESMMKQMRRLKIEQQEKLDVLMKFLKGELQKIEATIDS